MAEHTVFLADCPARSALELISGTWSVVVLCGLGHGPRRYSELLDRAGGISRKMLTQTLRRTAQAGLVTPPPRRGGAYRLTPLGESLMGPLTTLTSWAEEHGDELADVSGLTGLGTLGFLRDLYRRVLTPRTGRGEERNRPDGNPSPNVRPRGCGPDAPGRTGRVRIGRIVRAGR